MKKRSEIINKLSLRRGLTIRLYWTDAVYALSIGAFFIVSLELFYRMIVNYNGKYPSDMHHYAVTIATSGREQTRLLDWLGPQLYKLNNNTLEFNVFAAAIIAAIIIVNYVVIKIFLTDNNSYTIPRYSIQIASMTALFIGPVYFPILHEWYYRHSFDTFAWHSPTQQCMILFSMLATICFLKMFSEYEERISPVLWIATAALCFLSASSKPSFIIDFTVTIVILFLLELFSKGKDFFAKRFSKLFVMGCSLIPADIYILWLNSQEFGETTVSGEAHNIIFGIKVLLSHKDVPREMLFGIPFALIVMILNYKRFKESKYFLSFLIFLTGIMQWAFISETGKRAKYGNFDWGKMYGNYFISLVCLSLLLENIYGENSMFIKSRNGRKVAIFIEVAVLLMSVMSQLNYFRLILTGHGYML